MADFNVDLAVVRGLASEFAAAGADLETILNPVKQSGLEPPSTRVLPGDDAVSGYSAASSAISQGVVQLSTSLKTIGKKLEIVAANYEGADLASLIGNER